MTTEELEHQMDSLFRDLHRELGGAASASRVVTVARAHYESLNRDAAIKDFIPLLVYRFAKEELIASTRDDLSHAA